MNEEIYLSVSDVNKYIKTIIDRDPFLSYVNIKGEISNLKFHTRGHLYFSLKDETSKINAVMFNWENYNIGFIPKDGMSVEVKGKISVFVNGGNYQINVVSLKENGVGNLYLKYEELKKKLLDEGLFDETRKLKLPRIPQKIGVITASTGAAVRDIISTINRRFPLAEIILFPTLVQGEGAKENICKMLDAAYNSDVNVIIIGRGGGSIEDLWAFNEEIVARKIAEKNKPIISAVGHEIDYTICDFVSDLRAPTPTGAAEIVVPSQIEIIKYLNDYKSRIISVLNNKIQNYENHFNRLKSSHILKNPKSMYEIEEQKLDNIIEKLKTTLPYRLDKDSNKLSILVDKLNNIFNHQIERDTFRLKNLYTKLELLNPENILKKGYSLTLVNGCILKSTNDIGVGDIITTKLSDGNLISEIKEVNNGKDI